MREVTRNYFRVKMSTLCETDLCITCKICDTIKYWPVNRNWKFPCDLTIHCTKCDIFIKYPCDEDCYLNQLVDEMNLP